MPDHIIIGGAFKRKSPWNIDEHVLEGFEQVVMPRVLSRMTDPLEYGTHTGAAAIVGAKFKVAEEFAEQISWEVPA